MNQYDFKGLLSNLQEDYREFGMADTVFIHFKYNHLPIKVNGVIQDELKEFKASFCIYDGYIEDYEVYDYKRDIEMLVLQEYDDSPKSIYINEDSGIDSYEYENIHTIEIGNDITLKIVDGFITHYLVEEN